MKHATQRALDHLEGLLWRLRMCRGIRERQRGAFYRGSAAFLHFHEDSAGVYADVHVDGDRRRMPVNSREEHEALVRTVWAVTDGRKAPSLSA